MTIDGRAVEAVSGERTPVLDPATRQVVGRAPLAGAEDARRALRRATAALPAWGGKTVIRRAEVLERCAAMVLARRAELAELLTLEQGKPLAESEAEIETFATTLESFARLGRRARDGRLPLPPSRRPQRYGSLARAGRGVTLALVAWNFPVALMAKKIAPVLVAGGTVVVKPAFTTPLTSARIVALLAEEALPPGVLSCVTGRGETIAGALVGDPALGRVHLTGGDETGGKVAESFAGTDSELLLELAGSDPMIVCADADLDSAVKAAEEGRLRNAGQVCTAVKRLYLASTIHDEFLVELVRRFERREPGRGLSPARPPKVRLGPLHREKDRARIEAQLADGIRRGAWVSTGGSRPAGLALGYFFAPTVVVDPPVGCRLESEEVFGPVLPVFRVRDLDDAVAQVRRNRRLLGATIWTAEPERCRDLARRLGCRQLWINRLPFGVSERRAA